jgi:hypothetical protein
MYRMWTMRYALTTFANLVVLAVGIMIGVYMSPHLESRVQASSDPQTTPVVPTPAGNTPEQITPGVTTGTFGAYLVLAHHVQSDEMVVNGLDLLKLHEGELNLLSKTLGVTQQDVQNVVNNARDTHIYQIATPKPQSTPAPPK